MHLHIICNIHVNNKLYVDAVDGQITNDFVNDYMRCSSFKSVLDLI